MLSGRIPSSKDETGAVSQICIREVVASFVLQKTFIVRPRKSSRRQEAVHCKHLVPLQIFIDRDPLLFRRILNYLRTKEIDLK